MNAVRLAYLDGWRGCAILALLAGHFIGLPYINGGGLGVELFFVLSGRLMAHILFVDAMPLRIFYVRRFARICPAMVAFIALVSLWSQWSPEISISLSSAAAALTFTLNYVKGLAASGVLQHMWSLCVEEHSYLVLSLIALCTRNRGTAIKVLLALSAAAIVSGAIQTWVFGRSFFEVYWHTDARISSISVSAAAYLYFRDVRVHAVVPVLCAAAGILMQANVVPDPVKYSVGTTLLAVAVATIDKAPRAALWPLSTRWLTAFGTLSYSIYLWQQPASVLAIPYGIGMVKIAWIAAAILLGALSFRYIENPSRRWLNANVPRLVHRLGKSGPGLSALGSAVDVVPRSAEVQILDEDDAIAQGRHIG